MKVVIIGTGNVATVLGKKMHAAGVEIVQVVGRDEAKAASLAAALSATSSAELVKTNNLADLYIVAVPDSSIGSIAGKLLLQNKTVVHTAGAVSWDVLSTASLSSCRLGVLYPLQSLKKQNDVLPKIPVLIDGDSAQTIELLSAFAATWADNVAVAGNEERLKLHVAAVFANNFTNHMYVLAEQYCRQEQLDFNLLQPLIAETANRVQYLSPAEVQTGPAARGDVATQQAHLHLLEQYPRLQEVYRLLSSSIMAHLPLNQQ